jgi:hypothetical protein
MMNKITELFEKLNPLPDPAMAQEFREFALLICVVAFAAFIVAPLVIGCILVLLESVFGIQTAFTRELHRLEAEEKKAKRSE